MTTSTRTDDTLAEDVIRHRQALAWTKGRLAREAGVSVDNLTRLEEGRGGISVYTLRRIAKALGVTFTIGGNQ